MKRASRLTGLSAGALLFQGCASQIQQQEQQFLQRAAPAATSEVPKKAELTAEMRLIASRYLAAKKALYTKEVSCNPTANVCERVKIQISQPSDADGTYCVGLIPEKLNFGASDDVQKTIVWEIVYPADPQPMGSTFEFYNDDIPGVVDKVPGIVVITDSNPAQLKGKKIGNGNTGNKDPHFFTMKNDHKKKLDAAYLPIIVQRIPAAAPEPEKFVLCGTPDPRILND